MTQEDLDKYYNLLYSKNQKHDIAKYLEGKKVIIVGPAPYLEHKNIGYMIDGYDVVVRIKSGYPIPEPLKRDLGNRIDLWYTNLKGEQNHLSGNTYDEMEKNGLKTIIFPYPINYQKTDVFRTSIIKLISILRKNFKEGISSIQKHYKNKKQKCPFNISFDDNSYYFQQLEKIIGSRPTTGMLAIMDLLQYKIKKLQIVGFSFRYEVLKEQQKQSSDVNQFEGNPSKIFGLYSKYYKSDKSAIRSWKKTLANKTHEIIKELIFMKRLRDIDDRIKIDNYLANILEQV